MATRVAEVRLPEASAPPAVESGMSSPGSEGVLTRFVVLRGLALVCLLAILSLWVQVHGLVGARGLMPFAPWLERVAEVYGAEALWRAPTLLWWWPTDGGLTALCALGVLASLTLLVGVAEGPSLLVLLATYLSLQIAGQRFLGYQWDTLLTETLFVALFLASWRPIGWRAPAPAPAALWALRLLLFKLMFLAGWVKLASGDAVWRDLTALTYHYWTQPLPNPLSWSAHQQPMWLHQAACAAMFLCELVLPFGALLPQRWPRRLCFVGTVSTMGGLALTGNYGFFQLLTVVLALSLLDDADLATVVPGRWRPLSRGPSSSWVRWVVGLLLLPWLVLSVVRSDLRMRDGRLEDWPGWVQTAMRWTGPFRVVNAYGLFANMTEARPELIVEGSVDGGRTWVPYSFKAKPGALDRRPVQIARHMPRLGIHRNNFHWKTTILVTLKGVENI